MKFLSLLLLLSTTVFADEALETNSFLEIEKKINQLNKKFGRKNVLVVLDIDNTIMTMPQSLGSDQWFSWQYGDCIGKKKLPKNCITNNMGELLDLQGELFAVSNMIPTEKETKPVIDRLQSKGQKVFLLTSRGYQFRDATERALLRNEMNFKKSSIGPRGGYASTYMPYLMKKLKKDGITKDEATVSKLRKARVVSYMNGVMMTSGLNKGIMLKTLLHKTKEKFKAVVFVDDHKKHVKRMQQIFGKNNPIYMITYRYGKIDSDVAKFKKSNKSIVHAQYLKFKKTKESLFK